MSSIFPSSLVDTVVVAPDLPMVDNAVVIDTHGVLTTVDDAVVNMALVALDLAKVSASVVVPNLDLAKFPHLHDALDLAKVSAPVVAPNPDFAKAPHLHDALDLAEDASIVEANDDDFEPFDLDDIPVDINGFLKLNFDEEDLEAPLLETLNDECLINTSSTSLSDLQRPVREQDLDDQLLEYAEHSQSSRQELSQKDCLTSSTCINLEPSPRSSPEPIPDPQGRSLREEFTNEPYIIEPPPKGVYPSEELARKAVHEWTRDHDYDLIFSGQHTAWVKDPDSPYHKQIRKREMQCVFELRRGAEKHGKSRPLHIETKSQDFRTMRGSMKVGCGMRIILRSVDMKDPTGAWEIHHLPGDKSFLHRHPPISDPAVFPNHRKRAQTEAVINLIRDHHAAGIRTAQTLAVLEKAGQKVRLLRKDINNLKLDLRRDGLETRTIIEALFKRLDDGGYFYRFRIDPEQHVEALSIIHPDAFPFLKDCPYVLGIDCTFKTNRYNRKLLNMIGVTNENKAIPAAIAVMPGVKEEDFTLVLGWYREYLEKNEISIPSVILTDREQAEINAIGEVFPESNRLICRWHINECVLAYVRTEYGGKKAMIKDDETGEFSNNEQMNDAMEKYYACVEATTEDAFEQARQNLHETHPDIAVYMEREWFPYCQFWVKTWTNNLLHFDQTATSRVEAAHAALKKWLNSSRRDILSLFNALVPYWTLRYSQLQIEGDITGKFSIPFMFRSQKHYNDIIRKVSRYALTKVENQCRLARLEIAAKKRGEKESVYSRVFRTTVGLPCKHECKDILKYFATFKLAQFHPYWRLTKQDVVDTN